MKRIFWVTLVMFCFATGLTVQTASAADKSAPTIIRELRALVDSPDLRPLTGKTVKLTGVKILSVEGPRGFWIGGAGRSIFVLSARNVPLKAGEKVALTGVLSPSPADGELLEWRVSAETRERITKEGFYILAAVTKPGP